MGGIAEGKNGEESEGGNDNAGDEAANLKMGRVNDIQRQMWHLSYDSCLENSGGSANSI